MRRWQQRVRFSQALQRARTIQAQWRAHIVRNGDHVGSGQLEWTLIIGRAYSQARKKFGEMRRERFRLEASVRLQVCCAMSMLVHPVCALLPHCANERTRIQSVWRRQMVRTHIQRQRDSATQVQVHTLVQTLLFC